MRSHDPDRRSAQLEGRQPGAAEVHRGHRPPPKMAFHALSLAFLGLAMPSMALSLTSPALMPSVAGWDCSDPLNLTVSDASRRWATAASHYKHSAIYFWPLVIRKIVHQRGYHPVPRLWGEVREDDLQWKIRG